MKNFLSAVFAVLMLLPGELLAWKELNYASESNWVICEKAGKPNCEVDLFYVLPTIFSDKNKAYMQWHDKPEIQKKAELIARQNTGIFAGYTRVFAPYYRQYEFRRILKEISQPETGSSRVKREIFDVKNAFRYYLKHLNNGRPFILFGFSQGATVLLEVMKTELADPKVNAKLVAAYLIGYPKMPKSFPGFPHLRTAGGARDTGVIINYNSQAPGEVTSIFTGKGGFYCINPVNWRTDDKTASAAEHIGSRFFDLKSGAAVDRKSFVQSKIDPSNGALIVIPVENGKYDTRGLGQGVYHMFDLHFFYHDLRANGKARIEAFFKR